jgi:hypothetical protein
MAKSYAYTTGRKAGAANYPRTDNSHSRAIGESSEWDTGWVDGHTYIGWSKRPKASRLVVEAAAA